MIDYIHERLAGAPFLDIKKRASSLILSPQLPDGFPPTFPISIYDEGEECMISALRWHTHRDRPDDAFACVFWLLTPYARLVEEYKGGLYVSGWMEVFTATGWEAESPVYFLNPEHAEDWKAGPDEKYQLVIHQQAVLAPAQPYNDIVPGAQLEDDTGLPVGSHLGKVTVDSPGPTGLHYADR